jgi:16S rRNA (guanine527-N7)-methyltransferase
MDKLIQDAQTILGLRLTGRQVNALERFESELITWNQKYNLTAIRDSETIRTKHFLDSLSCLLVLREKPPASLIDIGTGAGFPGLPIKILMPNIRLTLVESVGKKADFCRHIINELKLENVDVQQGRAEELGQDERFREKYDWAVARAVSNLSTLVEYLLPFVRVGGAALAQKGESGPAEAHAAEHATRILGGHLRQLHKVCLPGVVEERFLLVIDKIAATPPLYPRRVGVPTKTPLTL